MIAFAEKRDILVSITGLSDADPLFYTSEIIKNPDPHFVRAQTSLQQLLALAQREHAQPEPTEPSWGPLKDVGEWGAWYRQGALGALYVPFGAGGLAAVFVEKYGDVSTQTLAYWRDRNTNIQYAAISRWSEGFAWDYCVFYGERADGALVAQDMSVQGTWVRIDQKRLPQYATPNRCVPYTVNPTDLYEHLTRMRGEERVFPLPVKGMGSVGLITSIAMRPLS